MLWHCKLGCLKPLEKVLPKVLVLKKFSKDGSHVTQHFIQQKFALKSDRQQSCGTSFDATKIALKSDTWKLCHMSFYTTKINSKISSM
jgi:hypothetical protein